MTDLIQITKTQIGTDNVNSVNSRDIHKYLEVKQSYSDWIKYQISKLSLKEDIDFTKHIHVVGKNRHYDYIVTSDAAKNISLISFTEKGQEIRDYFILVETQSKTPQQFQLPQNYIEALEALTLAEKDKIALTNTIHEKDKVILAVADLNIRAGDVTIGDFSKNLAIENLGRNNLFSWLKARNFIMMNTEPYQQYIARGYFVRKPSDKRINGEVKYTTMLTARGTVWLTKMLKAEFELDEVK